MLWWHGAGAVDLVICLLVRYQRIDGCVLFYRDSSQIDSVGRKHCDWCYYAEVASEDSEKAHCHSSSEGTGKEVCDYQRCWWTFQKTECKHLDYFVSSSRSYIIIWTLASSWHWIIFICLPIWTLVENENQCQGLTKNNKII